MILRVLLLISSLCTSSHLCAVHPEIISSLPAQRWSLDEQHRSDSTEQQRQINIYGSEIEQHRDKNQRCGNYFMFKRVNHFFNIFKNLTNLCTIIYSVQKKLVDYFIFYKIILKHHLWTEMKTEMMCRSNLKSQPHKIVLFCNSSK